MPPTSLLTVLMVLSAKHFLIAIGHGLLMILLFCHSGWFLNEFIDDTAEVITVNILYCFLALVFGVHQSHLVCVGAFVERNIYPSFVDEGTHPEHQGWHSFVRGLAFLAHSPAHDHWYLNTPEELLPSCIGDFFHIFFIHSHMVLMV